MLGECILRLLGERDAIDLARIRGGNDVVLRGQTNVSRSEPISVTIHDPPMFAATALAETLAGMGITIGNGPTRDRTIRARAAKEGEAGGWSTVGALETQIGQVLGRANKDSMNVYAEAMCKRLGAEVSRQAGSWQNGTAAMGAFVKSCGVSEGEFASLNCGYSSGDDARRTMTVRQAVDACASPMKARPANPWGAATGAGIADAA